MRIKLVGVSLAELESALKYSGLFVESDKDYAEIKAIPAFLASANKTQCGCDAARQLADLKERVSQKVKTLQAQTEEMGYKAREIAILLGKHEVKAEREAHKEASWNHYIGKEEYTPQAKASSLGSIEFWEALGDKHGLGSDFINSEVK